MEILKNVGKFRTLSKGQLVCTEGEEGNTLFILMKGRAEIIIDSYADNAKKIAELKEGSFFGEMSLLENKPRTATIAITSPSATVMEIEQKDFAKVLEEEPSLGYRLLITLNSRMNKMLENIEPYDKRYTFQYRKQEMYMVIQKLGEAEFLTVCQQNKEYIWKLLKFLSTSLDNLNQIYLKKRANLY